MIIIGERLNSTRSQILQALESKDEKYLVDEAKKEEAAGANYIDLNAAALLDKEAETLCWAISVLQKELNIPLSIDTPDPRVMEEGLKIHKGQAIMNSLSGETKKTRALLPFVRKYRPRVIALCLDDEGLPQNSDKELSIAARMVSLLEKEGLRQEDIFLDPLVRPVGADQKAGELFLESLEKIKKNFPQVRTVAGISNISFGLPRRKLLNRTFLVLALRSGLDAAILDPLDKEIIAALSAAEAFLGKDPSLKNYLKFIRSGKCS